MNKRIRALLILIAILIAVNYLIERWSSSP